MKEKSRKFILLPANFQEELTKNELKYESGERSSYLLKEMISLYQIAKDYYELKKNKTLSEFFNQKYEKLIAKPDTLSIIDDSYDKFINIQSTTYSSNQPSDKRKNQTDNEKVEEKLLTLNDTVLGKNYFNLGKSLANEFKSRNLVKRRAFTIKANNNKLLTNHDETHFNQPSSSNINLYNTNSFKGFSPRFTLTERNRSERILSVENCTLQEIKQNYRSNDNIYSSNNKCELSVIKTFKKIKNYQMYQKIHNQINNILLKLMKTNEKFNTAVNNDMERQKEKFLEMKNFKKEEQITQTLKIKKFLKRRGSKLEEIFKSISNFIFNLVCRDQNISQDELINEIILFIEKQLLLTHSEMNKEIESFISKNIKEMNSAVLEIEVAYAEEIKEIQKFEELGSEYTCVILNLKKELNDEIKILKEKYEENRAKEIKKIKMNYLKHI